MSCGLGGGMHSVLRDFVHAARGRLLVDAIKMIERAGAFADRETVLDGLLDVSFGKQHRIAKRPPRGKLRGDG